MKLNTYKTSGIIFVIMVIGLLSVLSTLFFPSNTVMLIICGIIGVSTIVIGCTGIIAITYQDIKYGEINLEKTNVKRCLKENYKLMLFMAIYAIIILSVFVFVEFIYALIITGIIVGIIIICDWIYFRVNVK